MPRKRDWIIDGVAVSRADVRRWMQSVGHRVPPSYYWDYVRDWDVPGKILAAKRRGVFEAVIGAEAARAGVQVRAARRPGPLARLRGVPAANCGRWDVSRVPGPAPAAAT